MASEKDKKLDNESHSNGFHSPASIRLGTGEGDELEQLGYVPELHRNRSMLTLLFQSLAIAATPYGVGGPIMSSIYGGGQLSIFVGWVVTVVLAQCVALSIAELASRYPTSAGPYYWSFQIATKAKVTLSFLTGWVWLIGNWTITLSVNFGFASLIAAAVTMYHPDITLNSWQLLLIFYAILVLTYVICAFGNKYLPHVDTFCAAWTAVSIIVILIAMAVEAKAGRHSAGYALGHYDKSLSGWGDFTFFIGLLPSAYTFCAIGMISSMAEETADPTVKVPKAISLSVPTLGISGLFYVLPICFTLPPLADITTAPYGQALPYIFQAVMGSNAGGMGLLFLVLGVTLFCSLSITCAASRCTWAFARDKALPLHHLWSRVHHKTGVPLNALTLCTVVQALLGIINIGSTSAFTAFVSVGVIALAISYAIPITISLLHRRKEVNSARFTCGHLLGTIVNVIAVAWILFQLVLFSMPTVLPVTSVSMNYASVVLAGFIVIAAAWYFVQAHKGMFYNYQHLPQPTDSINSIQRTARLGWHCHLVYG